MRTIVGETIFAGTFHTSCRRLQSYGISIFEQHGFAGMLAITLSVLDHVSDEILRGADLESHSEL